jgi:tetratricopeptide (TPR) repeat protein
MLKTCALRETETLAPRVSRFDLMIGITRQCYPMHQEQRNQHLRTLNLMFDDDPDLDSVRFSMLRSIHSSVFFSPLLRFDFMNYLLRRVSFSGARSALLPILALLLTFGLSSGGLAQSEDSFGDTGADPVKLFERGQNAHGRGDLIKALELYEEAIKVRPEFPEAEFQRANVLVALSRKADAESGFRRTIELRKNWPLPYAALGALLTGMNRDKEAEPLLRQALKLESNNNLALRMLADIRLRAGDSTEALSLARRATADKEAPAATWLLRAMAERAAGDNVSALASLDHILELEPLHLSALIERAEIRIANGAKDLAIPDLASAEPLIKGERVSASRVAAAYELAGKTEDARRVAHSAGILKPASGLNEGIQVVGSPEEIEAANSEDPEATRKALEALLLKNPNNAMLLARLGNVYRTTDPSRSLDYYRRAVEIEPKNADYATGYSSALVQARRFPDAVVVLRRVLSVAPDNYAAHANLATALYALKHYPAALSEYQWLLKAKPDLAVAYYFIATSHDYLGEYQQALEAYETFVSRADPKTNQLEIEKVKLRLPTLRRQIKLGEGVKPNRKG